MRCNIPINLDKTEEKILSALQSSGRMSNVELAESVGLSESPTFRRVRRLEEDGIIQGYAAVVDQRKLGLDVTAFVLVSMDRQSDEATEAFHQAVKQDLHIMECYAMSGSHDYLMKVVASDIDQFSELVMDQILKFPGVRHVESNFSLREIKHSRVLPSP